jgi:hypothetical protein
MKFKSGFSKDNPSASPLFGQECPVSTLRNMSHYLFSLSFLRIGQESLPLQQSPFMAVASLSFLCIWHTKSLQQPILQTPSLQHSLFIWHLPSLQQSAIAQQEVELIDLVEDLVYG